MTKPIWNGRGNADGAVYFTKNDGTIVGRGYVRRRVSAGLGRWRGIRSLEARREALRRTVDNGDWLRARAGQTVGSLIRAAEDVLLRIF